MEQKAGYSADEFESDSEETKTPKDLNKFVVSLGKAEEEDDEAESVQNQDQIPEEKINQVK